MHVVLGDRSERSFPLRRLHALLPRAAGAVRRRVAGLANAQPPADVSAAVRALRLCDWRERCEAQRVADDHLCQVADITRIADRAAAGRRHRHDGQRWRRCRPTPACRGCTPTRSPSCARRRRCRTTCARTGERQRAGAAARCRAPARLLPPAARRTTATSSSTWRAIRSRTAASSTCSASGSCMTAAWHLPRLLGAQPGRGARGVRGVHGLRRRSGGASIPARTSTTTRSYEETALKRLAQLHATREVEIDNLLRQRRWSTCTRWCARAPHLGAELLDQVRRALLPRGARRRGADRGREHRVLRALARDARCAAAARHRGLQPRRRRVHAAAARLAAHAAAARSLPWKTTAADAPPKRRRSAAPTRAQQAERRLVPYRERLVDALPADRAAVDAEHRIAELTYQLLDFHRRADKPAWWAMYARMELTKTS